MTPELSQPFLASGETSPHDLPSATVPCVYCRLDIAAGLFAFRSSAKRLVTGVCPSCGRLNTLSAATWRRWAGLSLPIVPPNVADLSIAGQYIPCGSRGEPIAGDFFDVVEVAPGRIVVAVGDVSGHGVEAAARMNTVRAAMQAIAADVGSPVEVLERLDRLQMLGHPEDIATMWLGRYNPSTGVLHYASAGHLPPIIAGFGDRTIALAEAGAPPLGAGVSGTPASLHQIFLPVGGYVVAYSDGLVERPGRDLDQQLGLLRDVIERASAGAGDRPTARELVDSVMAEFMPDLSRTRDDVCLLVVRREAKGVNREGPAA